LTFSKRRKRSISVCFPVEMDDGAVRTFHGYRVLHSSILGPGKGGIRYLPEVTREEVMSLVAGFSFLRPSASKVRKLPSSPIAVTSPRHHPFRTPVKYFEVTDP
jgi:hypothetical protein